MTPIETPWRRGMHGTANFARTSGRTIRPCDQRSHESNGGRKPIETIIDHIEYDEGRDPVAAKAWDSV